MFSIEERICRNGQTSVSASVGRMRARTQTASHDTLACGGGEFRDDLNECAFSPKVLSWSKCTLFLR
jgi:hypothetical protein